MITRLIAKFMTIHVSTVFLSIIFASKIEIHVFCALARLNWLYHASRQNYARKVHVFPTHRWLYCWHVRLPRDVCVMAAKHRLARAAWVSQGSRHLLCLPDPYILCNMDQVHQSIRFTSLSVPLTHIIWFDFCFTALLHILGHFGRGQLP